MRIITSRHTFLACCNIYKDIQPENLIVTKQDLAILLSLSVLHKP